MMCDIKQDVEGPGTCRGCLSSDRKLASVRTLTSCDLYYSLLTEDQRLETSTLPHIALCWECVALLGRAQRFQEQVQKAHTILQESLELSSAEPTLSSLAFHRKHEYDYVLEENQPYEIPLFHTGTENATIENDKVIIPTKHKFTVTRSNVQNVKNMKDVEYDYALEENHPYEIPLFHTETQNATIENDKVIIPTKHKSTATRSNVQDVKNMQDVEYDYDLEEDHPYEIPLLYIETQNATIENDKVIVPTKHKTTARRSNVQNVKNMKDVIFELLSKAKIKSENVVVEQTTNDSYCYDSKDNVKFEADDRNFSSSEEISEVENKLQRVTQPKPKDTTFRKKVIKRINKKHCSNDGEDSDNEYKPKRKGQNKSNLNPDSNLEYKDNYASDDRVQNNKKHCDSDSKGNECKQKRKRQKKLELDPDFNSEDNDNYASDDSEYKQGRIKKTKEQSDIDPNLSLEDKDATITKNKRPLFRKIITQYKDIAELAPYFTEIEMSEQDIKIALERDDAIVDERVKKKPIKCILCGLMYKQIQTLTFHAVRQHKTEYPNQMHKGNWVNPPPDFPQKSIWQCNVCMRMLRKEHLIAHMNEYHRTQYFCNGDGCEWSQRHFWIKKDLDEHWEEIHKQFMCEYCEKYKKSKKSLEKHIHEAHATRVKYVTNQCNVCKKVLSSLWALRLHVAYVHEEKNREPREQRYCVECNITFKRIKGFESHFIRLHSGKTRSGYPCETCGRVLASKITYKNHVNIIHNGKTPHRCHICGKYLSKKQVLQQHLDAHNNKKRPKTKPCAVCGRMFQDNRILRNHMYTHTGERPYKCPHCETAFTQTQCLRVHLAKQHQVVASVRSDGRIIEIGSQMQQPATELLDAWSDTHVADIQ